MVFILELAIEALFWVVVLILRLFLEFAAEILLRGFIWLLAWFFRATGRQFTLGSRGIQLMVGVRLANADWFEEALTVLPVLDASDDPTDPRTRAFGLTRAWIHARRGDWDDVKRELETLSKPEVLASLPPRSLALVAELGWAADEREVARSALIAAAQDDWHAERAATFDALATHWSSEPDMPAPVWPGWPSKLRIKYGPISVAESKLHKATRRLRSGWRNANNEAKRKKARAKLEKVVKGAPGSLVASMAEAELPRLDAEAGMYR